MHKANSPDKMSASTPSPTSSSNNAASHGASRRPPRKSTLTQQQKNQKRQRATQDQLVPLEVEFNKNPTPTAAVRERIAQEINMTERSVQIWFQNKRAKIKQLAKKSIETGEDCDAIPDSYRNYLAMQAMESGTPLARNFMAQGSGPAPFGNGTMMMGTENGSQPKVVIHHFSCRSLTIGSWRRVGQAAMDLVVFYSVGERPCLTYYINNESAGYKVEFPFSSIKNITLESGSLEEPNRSAGLLVELHRAPSFFMDSAGTGGFYQCGDFTEDQQASQIMVHRLGGDPRVLSGQLAKLTLLEAFQNRHVPIVETTAVVSAPVSPVFHRPASQPNAMSHPHLNMFPESGFGVSLYPGARGHKRTRSRSVPAMNDMSFLTQTMPSFHVQQPSTTFTDPSIFAPVPQHPHALLPTRQNTLQIDTSSRYSMGDFRQNPMSAATTASPSDYASPGFFSSAQMDTMPSTTFNPSYTIPYLSPMADAAGIQPSVSPLSTLSQHAPHQHQHALHDPVIANQSPPLANMVRSASADFLTMSQDPTAMADERLMLSEMYSKQTLSLPSPHLDDADGTHLDMLHENAPGAEDMDMQSMLQYGTIDPSNLTADSMV